LSDIDEKLRTIKIVILLLFAIPVILFLLAYFNIYPPVSPIVGTWKGNIHYADNWSSSQKDATFTFTKEGNCAINLDQTYWNGYAYATQRINKYARWKQEDDRYYLLYESDNISMYIENINGVYSSSKNLIFNNLNVDGKASPFQGILVLKN
jgi:hypothetical protein